MRLIFKVISSIFSLIIAISKTTVMIKVYIMAICFMIFPDLDGWIELLTSPPAIVFCWVYFCMTQDERSPY